MWCEKDQAGHDRHVLDKTLFLGLVPKLFLHIIDVLYVVGDEIVFYRLAFAKNIFKANQLFSVYDGVIVCFDVTVRVYLSFPRVVNLRFKTLGKKGLVSLFPRR